MAGFPDNLLEKNPNKKNNNNNKNKLWSVLNRSLTIHSSAHDFSKKNLLSSMERNGSIKKLSSSIAGKVKFFESSSSPIKPSKQKSSNDNDDDFVISGTTIGLPGTEDRVVVYFTSLRGIRRTYEDCYAVRMILRAFRIDVDERDISMDSAYKKELQGVLGRNAVVGLPQVFVKGKYVGGAEKVKHLNEIGELRKMLKGLAIRAPGSVCDMCGDVRFVPCMECNGSRKVYDEDEERMRRCVECNENGLIRCPTCCSS